jgi:hypothetical protein
MDLHVLHDVAEVAPHFVAVPFGGGGEDRNVEWMQRGGYWSEVEHHYERVTQQQVEMIATT